VGSCEKNLWTHKRRRKLDNKNVQGDKLYITMARHCKIYKVTLRLVGHFGRMNNERLPKQSSDCQNGRCVEKRKTMEN